MSPGVLQRYLAAIGLVCFLLPSRADAEAATIVGVRNSSGVKAGDHVELQGVVTYSFGGNADFFLQDETAGIYVKVDAATQLARKPAAGERVSVEGTVNPGDFAPTILAAFVELHGTDRLPIPRQTTYPQLAAGLEDSQRVTVHGIVRSAAVLQDQWYGRDMVLTVVDGEGRFLVRLPDAGDNNLDSWVNTTISVTGVAGGVFNHQQQLIGIVIYAPSVKDIQIEDRPASDPFQLPVSPAASLLRFSTGTASLHRIKVAGIVLYSDGDRRLFIKDASSGLEVMVSAITNVSLGDAIEAIGFPNVGEYAPVLQDASIRCLKKGSPPTAQPTTPEQLVAGNFNHDLVRIQATVFDQISDAQRQVLILESQGRHFEARIEKEFPHLPRFERGTLLEVTGVSILTVIGPAKTPAAFYLLLRDPADVQVLHRPSWWTVGRVLATIGVLAGIILAALIWAAMVARKNLLLNEQIGERRRVERELQEAKSELEQRVEERTVQLHQEINGRQQAEMEFSIILKERARIAQELHDTLEQSLVGIGLQLDSVAQAYPSDPHSVQRHLAMACNMVRHSQAETRRSIWDLRSQSLEDGDLVSALATVCRHLSAHSGVAVSFEMAGVRRNLPVLTENNLFRIGQEAITNALKHARASHVAVHLDYEEGAIVLQVTDDGAGFDLDRALPGDGHFGLQGIRERARRLRGDLQIRSSPGAGTEVRIEVSVAVSGMAGAHASTADALCT